MRSFWQIFIKAYYFLINLVFPIECLGCKEENTWLCDKCLKEIKINNKQQCPFCKKENNTGQTCNLCQKNKNLNGVWIAGDYNNPLLAKIIKIYKYRFIKDLSQILGSIFNIFIKKNIANFPTEILEKNKTVIIPMPLHKKRQAFRGFNQSELLACSISEKLNLRLNKNLIRTKHSQPQMKLNRQARLENIKNCFNWTGKNLLNKNIILIDDVITTGSTLEECAKILKENGANKVWGMVLARG